MNSANLLDEVWETYQTTKDCLKVASRSIDKSELHLLKSTNFINLSSNEAVPLIEKSRVNADDYVILYLWAVFERQLYEYLQNECRKILDNDGSNFNKHVHKKIDTDIEYWKIDDTLDVFKAIVEPNLLGNAKQIKKYRDWIAHRNPRKGQPDNVSPQKAYEVLSDILSCLEEHFSR